MIYKDHYIWYNDARTVYPWMLQQGGTVIGTYSTLAAAKGAATRHYNGDWASISDHEEEVNQ